MASTVLVSRTFSTFHAPYRTTVCCQMLTLSRTGIGSVAARAICSPTQTVLQRSYATAAVPAGGAGKHWRAERIVSVGLLAMIPTGLVYPNMLCDYGIALLLPLHNHWGFESIIVDYVPKSLQSVTKLLLYAVTVGVFGGLMYLNFSDVGTFLSCTMVIAMQALSVATSFSALFSVELKPKKWHVVHFKDL